ncbi:peptide synthetase [Nocardia sp. NBC_01009]|uniref:peptide synthetase n=1 Tax=Nocardia sp. NBC_01009 TaxID=2975996 RepID=UPI00386DAA58|nr:peptide synthetase [Nocardia sp. NBC_01009]
MGNDSIFRRPISPTERMYFPMRQLAPPFLMQAMIHGEGTIDREALRQAVAVASDACPGARLRRMGGEWVDSGIAPAVRVVDRHTVQYPDLETDHVLTSPIGPYPGATAEVVLLTAEPVTLLFRAFHGVMDGMGMVLWMTNVLKVLRGETPDAMPDPVADYQLVARIGTPPGKATLPLPKYRSAVGRGRQEPDRPRHLLRHRTIDATGSGGVARVAAILAEQTEGPSRIMMPVDLRRHDPQLRSTANLALPLFLDLEPGQDWTVAKAQLKAGLAQRRELNQMDNSGLVRIPDLVGRAILRTTNWLGSQYGRNLASAIVSHVGVFDLDALSPPGFRPTTIRVVPQHSVAMPLLFGLVESGGKTELSVSCRNGVGIEARLEALLDHIVARLEQELPVREKL